MSLPELSFADVVQPAWNVSPRVRALVTTRNGGVSEPPFGRWQDGVDQPGGLNLGMKAGDDPAAVATNRARLLKLATELKAEVDKSSKDTLSVSVIRKAEEIEKLARSVKETTRLGAGPT